MKKLFALSLGVTFSLLASSQVQQLPQRVVTDPGGGYSMFIGQGSGKTTTNANIAAEVKAWYTCYGYLTCGGQGVGMSAPGVNGENTAMGVMAGGNWSTAVYSTALGVGALRFETTGPNNTAVGADAMLLGSGNSHSVAVGVNALQAANGTQYNIAIGDGAIFTGAGSFTGNFNIAIGGNALGAATATNAGANIAIGHSAMGGAAVTTASNNVAIGFNSLGGASMTTAGSNVAVGYQTLQVETTGAQNTAVGYNAGKLQVGQGNNTFIGALAGQIISSGNHNVFVGANGTATCQTGSTNILLGYGLDCAASGTANIIGIGGTGSTYVWGATGTGTPSTATTTIAGGLTLPNVTTGTNADFVCMAAGNVLTLQTSACTISSRRFKENIEDMQGSALPEIGKMEVASFRLKDTHNKDPNARSTQTGLIAENIARVSPECAIYEDDMRTPKSYRQECVIALLVKATQEQQAQINMLKRHLRHRS